MNFLKIYIGLFLFLFTFQLVSAQVIVDTTVENALLWEISGNGIKKPSYLYGTFHFFCKEDIVLPEILKNKIIESDKIFLEREMDLGDTLVKNGISKKYFTYDYKVNYLIGEDNFRKAVSIINAYKQVPEDTLNRLNIGIFRHVVLQSYLGCNVGSYDYAIGSLALGHGKKIYALGINQNIGSFQMNGFIDPRILPFIKKNWNNLAYDLSQLQIDIALYKEKKITALYLRSSYQTNGLPISSKEKLIDDRNEEWVQTIKKSVKKRTCFFAFGCAHLPGSKGVIALLRKKGFTITPVYF